MTEYPDDPTAVPDDVPDTEDPTVQHATIAPEAVAATAGDGSELPPAPVDDPYDVPNPDEVDPDPGPPGMPPPDFTAGAVQDTGDSPDAA